MKFWNFCNCGNSTCYILLDFSERQRLIGYNTVKSGWYGGHILQQSHIKVTAGGRD